MKKIILNRYGFSIKLITSVSKIKKTELEQNYRKPILKYQNQRLKLLKVQCYNLALD